MKRQHPVRRGLKMPSLKNQIRNQSSITHIDPSTIKRERLISKSSTCLVFPYISYTRIAQFGFSSKQLICIKICTYSSSILIHENIYRKLVWIRRRLHAPIEPCLYEKPLHQTTTLWNQFLIWSSIHIWWWYTRIKHLTWSCMQQIEQNDWLIALLCPGFDLFHLIFSATWRINRKDMVPWCPLCLKKYGKALWLKSIYVAPPEGDQRFYRLICPSYPF